MTKKRILIVEDQGITAMDEEGILLDMEYEVCGIVMTGESAVQRAFVDKPDLILMDIMLGGKMDGREATTEIRKSFDIPVIYVTAFGGKATSKSEKIDPPEGIGYVVKPFTKEELRSEIERLIG